MDLFIDKKKVPNNRLWKWNENEIGYEGVCTNDGMLKWFTFRNAHNAPMLAAEQSFEAYIKDGPMKESIPADIMLDIYDVIMNATQTDNLY